jgi:hypothetical protein
MVSFREFMLEQRLINRKQVVLIAMSGAFAGAILMFVINLLATVSG